MHAPTFWKDKTFISTALLPFSAAYYVLARANHAFTPTKEVSAHVVCVGNMIAGGAGKTPVALALGTLLKKLGRNAHFLSRGYKSDNTGVTRVDRTKHTAREVGDEPLLLAEVLPTWVAKDRAAGAEAAVKAGAEIIIMDDGFQNPGLKKDVSLLVIDGHYGFGNGRLLPAGPMREPLEEAIERASAVVLISDDRYNVLQHIPKNIPLFQAHITPVSSAEFLKGKEVVAFCGIARPRKFYRTLQAIGCSVRKHVSYPDHHDFRLEDLEFLRARAKEYNALLVTTEKDYVRLPEDMRAEVSVVPIEAAFADPAAVLGVVLGKSNTA